MRTFFIAVVATPILALTTTLLLSSCRFLGGERINGNGNVTTQQRGVGNFDGVEAGGDVEVRVRQDAATSVKIQADENLQQYIESFVEGGTLVVRTKQGYNLDPSKSIVVYVSAPEFKHLDISGASKLFGDTPLTSNDLDLQVSGASEINLDVKASRLKADVSGASSLQLKGSANKFDTEASGASHLRCMDLQTDETTLDLSGASNAEVTADKQLNIDASGASEVKYKGNANINQKSSGASSVQKI